MKKLSLPGASIRLLALFALTTPIFAGTITETTLSISRSTNDTGIFTSSALEAESALPALISGRTDNSNSMSGVRSYTSIGNTQTWAFSTTCDFLKAVRLINDPAISLSSVNFGRIPFQQMLIISTAGSETSAMPSAQLPEPPALTFSVSKIV